MIIQPENPTKEERHLLIKAALKKVHREEDFESLVKLSSPPKDILSIAPQNSFKNIRVGIIGGGVAGLSTAYELRKLGYDITILEANPIRVGGRIYTHYFDNKHYGELGAMRIPVTHETSWHYIDLFKLNTEPFISDSENNIMYVKRERIRGLNLDEEIKQKIYPKFKLTETEKKYIFSEIISIIYNNQIQRLPIELREEFYQIKKQYSYPINYYDYHNFRQILFNLGFSEAMIELLYSTLGIDRNLFSNNFLELIKENYSVNYGYLYRIKNGLVNLPLAFINSFNLNSPNLGNVTFKQGCHVIDIIYDHNKVKLNYVLNKGFYTEEFDYVVCAIPFSMLRTINTYPMFSNEKVQAIAEINYIPAQKTIFFFKERFWERTLNNKPVVGGNSVTDLAINTMWYPSKIINKNDPRGVFMGSYNLNLDSTRIDSLKDEISIYSVLRQIAEVHGLPFDYLKSIFIDYRSINWNNEPYALGGFRWDNPENNRLFSYDAITPEYENHLFFAGEHISQYHSWLQGALQSGMEAANQVAEFSKLHHWK